MESMSRPAKIGVEMQLTGWRSWSSWKSYQLQSQWLTWPRWERSNCNCRASSRSYKAYCPGSHGKWSHLSADSLTCLVLGRKGVPPYLGGHERAGAHPYEEVGGLSAHGTAPPGPLAPASPVQERRVKERPVSRLRSEECMVPPGDIAGLYVGQHAERYRSLPLWVSGWCWCRDLKKKKLFEYPFSFKVEGCFNPISTFDHLNTFILVHGSKPATPLENKSLWQGDARPT